MKKLAYALLLILPSVAHGEHLVPRDATSLTVGKIPDARLNASSVTLQGNNFSFEGLASSIANISASTNTLFTQIKSTAVQLSNFQISFSTVHLHISNTNYIYVSTAIQSGSSIHIVTGTIDSFNSSVGTFTKSVSVTRLIFNDGTNQITAASGGGIVGNSTFSKTITVGGEIVYSSATFPFFPGAWWVPEQSTCTITQVLATVQRPSGASAAFPFYAVAQSSWQWSTYGQLAVTTNTQTSIWKTENIVLTSTSTFGVGVTSAAVSNPASDLGLTFKYWCNQY